MKRIPVFVKITIKLYLLLIAIFFAFRAALLLLNLDRVGETTFWEVFQAFVMGVRFDIVTIGFVIAIPTIILTIFSFFGKKSRLFEKIYTWVLTVCFTITFGICAADIPYFDQFFDRFNITAFEWMATGDSVFVFKMIWEEPTYILMMLPVLGCGFVFWFFANRILKNSKDWESVNYVRYGIATVLLWGLVFIGMRGRLNEKSPIMVGTAYFGNNAMLNQLGLNPNFTLARSWLDSKNPDNQKVVFMSDESAIALVQKNLGIENPDPDFPIARTGDFSIPLRFSRNDEEPFSSFRPEPLGVAEKSPAIDTVSNNYNVIVVIMEGMSYNKTAHGGNTHNLTPFLDSLMCNSLSFKNCYTSGTHTYCGIYSTFVSYPVIFRNMPLKRIPVLQYDGIAATLQKNGYQTAYFTTHDKEFDNVAGFLTQNGVERIISQADYPISEVKTTLGVPDDYMFRFAIPIFDEMANKGRPFFAAMMTASDHGPFYVPEYFTPRSEDVRYQITEYADWSLRRFIEMSQEKPWFDNTLFVFVADHGAVLDTDYSIPLSYFHTPLVFYMPKHLQTIENETIASQMDVFPTVMGILGKTYINNSFGIDLQRENRRYAYFMSDDKYGVIDGEWLFVNKPAEGQKGLYKYVEKEKKNYISEYPEVASEMQKYGESAWQVNEYQLDKKKTKFLSHE